MAKDDIMTMMFCLLSMLPLFDCHIQSSRMSNRNCRGDAPADAQAAPEDAFTLARFAQGAPEDALLHCISNSLNALSKNAQMAPSPNSIV